jgi:hypothetical protein
MRFQPVFLVAPAPAKASKADERAVDRRAFLSLGIGAFLLGSGLGYAAGRGVEGAVEGPLRTGALDPGDRRTRHLAWARGLAEGRIEDLHANATGFLIQLNRTPEDPVLWQGLDRLARHVTTTTGLPDRSLLAGSILDFVDRFSPAGGLDFGELRPALQAIDWR